mmetsp:Transcript_5006/g.11446  ORF Transcript_5006/g.11446 Transcript_5006/m.11446 type:complete len:82 (-) Transcript_5006:69-314(-)
MKGNQSHNASSCNSDVEYDEEDFADVDSLNTDASAPDNDEMELRIKSDTEDSGSDDEGSGSDEEDEGSAGEEEEESESEEE